MSTVEEAVEALRSGRPVVLPTDTVYGLCGDAYEPAAAARLYRLKGRAATQPSALFARDVDLLLESVPELGGSAAAVARALLPGQFTLVVPNPARRFSWLAGTRPETLGVRVADLPEPTARVLERVGAVVATSANVPGGPDPRTLADVPADIRAGAGAELDAGALSGVPSTVIDLTGPEPKVLREGAVPASEALARVSAATA